MAKTVLNGPWGAAYRTFLGRDVDRIGPLHTWVFHDLFKLSFLLPCSVDSWNSQSFLASAFFGDPQVLHTKQEPWTPHNPLVMGGQAEGGKSKSQLDFPATPSTCHVMSCCSLYFRTWKHNDIVYWP